MKKIIFSLVLIVFCSNVTANDRFIRDNTKEVVLDTKTTLMWQDNNDTSTITKNWSDAINYCENLTLGDYDDWYLPNFNQLFALTNRSKYNPAISDIFQNVSNSYYWSSTLDVHNTIYICNIKFDYGSDTRQDRNYDGVYIRCVRDNN